MKLMTYLLLSLLTGCTSVPVSVGGLGLCVGLCRFEIIVAAPPAPSAAEKIGGGLASLLVEKLTPKRDRDIAK
jgi:hypothetical protein